MRTRLERAHAEADELRAANAQLHKRVTEAAKASFTVFGTDLLAFLTSFFSKMKVSGFRSFPGEEEQLSRRPAATIIITMTTRSLSRRRLRLLYISASMITF